MGALFVCVLLTCIARPCICGVFECDALYLATQWLLFRHPAQQNMTTLALTTSAKHLVLVVRDMVRIEFVLFCVAGYW